MFALLLLSFSSPPLPSSFAGGHLSTLSSSTHTRSMSKLRLFCCPLPFLLPLLLIHPNLSSATITSGRTTTRGGCPVSQLQTCAEPLRSLGVPLSKNLVRLLLQIPSPNQLRRNCQAYSSVMPCFHSKVAECGSSAQREILRQLANALQFLCSPFSSLHQSQLLVHRLCIGRVLGHSPSPDGCANQSSAILLHPCREQCHSKGGTNKFACLIRTWLSEQNLCLLDKMRRECGGEATAFYTKMQKEIFHSKFPLICAENGREFAERTEKRQHGPNGGGRPSSSTPPSIFVTSKKKGVKTVTRLSENRHKVGGSTKRMATGKVERGRTEGNNTRAGNGTSGKKTMATTMMMMINSQTGTTTTKLPRNDGAKSPPPRMSPSRTSGYANRRPPPPIRPIPATEGTTTPAFPLATLPIKQPMGRGNATKKGTTASGSAVNLLVQRVPFAAFLPSALSQHASVPAANAAIPGRNQMLWEGAAERGGHVASPAAATLVFFEVAPIDEMMVRAAQFQQDNGKRRR